MFGFSDIFKWATTASKPDSRPTTNPTPDPQTTPDPPKSHPVVPTNLPSVESSNTVTQSTHHPVTPSVGKSKRLKRCHSCGKTGHLAKNCRTLLLMRPQPCRHCQNFGHVWSQCPFLTPEARVFYLLTPDLRK